MENFHQLNMKLVSRSSFKRTARSIRSC